MKLIINAEDLGLSKSINKGIFEGLKQGYITSASMFVNAKYSDDAIKYVKENNIKNVGIHLNLTYGKPVLNKEEIPNLVENDGTFHYMCSMPFFARYEEVKKELKAQIEKFLSFGLTPSHLDYHHYFYSSNEVLKAYFELAKEFNLPVRTMTEKERLLAKEFEVKTTDLFVSDFHESYQKDENTLKSILDFLNDKDVLVELMTTPGYVDGYTTTQTNYLRREDELFALKQAYENGLFKNITLTDFNDLKE